MADASRPLAWYAAASREDVEKVLASAVASLQQLPRGLLAAQPSTSGQLCALLKAVQAAMQHGKAGGAAPTAALVPCLQALLSYGADQPPTLPPRGGCPPPQQRSPEKYIPPGAWRAVHPTAFSDSESSDTEAGGGGGEAGRAARVRSLALRCMQLLIKADPKALHPFWTSLLPMFDAADAPPGAAGPPSLARVLLHDPSPRLRHSAAATISTLLEGPAQRAYLAVAEARGMRPHPVRGFVTLSASLGQAVVATHQVLLRCARCEREPAVRAAALRALGTLLAGAPYHRLPPQLLPLCVDALVLCLRQAGRPGGAAAAAPPPDHLPVLVAGLGGLAAAFGAPPPSAALLEWLAAGGEGLVEELFALAQRGAPAVQLEAVMALRGLAQQYRGLVYRHWDQVLGMGVEAATSDVAPAAAAASPNAAAPQVGGPGQQEGGSLLERVAQQRIRLAGDYLPPQAAPEQNGTPLWGAHQLRLPPAQCSSGGARSNGAGGPTGAEARREGANGATGGGELHSGMWPQGLRRCFLPALRHSSAVVRAAALAAIAGAPPELLRVLGPTEQARLLRAVCASAAGDGASPVRAAAARALASLLREAAVLDAPDGRELVVATLQSSCRDAVLAVRAQAAWALASLAETALEAGPAHLPLETAASQVLLQLAREAALDGERVKPGGVRALGALLASASLLASERPAPAEAAETLLWCLREGGAKVQWSACDAAAVYLRAAPAGEAAALVRGALREVAEHGNNQRTRALAAAAASHVDGGADVAP